MNNQTEVIIQRIEDKEDLEALIPGDALNIVFKNTPEWKFGEEKFSGAYHGKSDLGFYQFLQPTFMGEEYIIVYAAVKERIDIIDGKIILKEGKASIHSFTPTNPEYEKFNKTLKMSGLR